ncbi:restriction endonuclease subunit S [Myroides marinus]|uniref:restriction endonuclease subunit S n=1 Tax=Myroides marinus TaxID=703342 RepID=UPI00257631A8|nr:restriction endonuclease subunit S [Myroides marinus]MDM1350712.1 restriction endonuclease subunit S [Myroides marinus]MDM1357919.1 restriction endonuclease subunit S [Myroides marinus]MDM1365959.1 restriction endonuclease subunit S [Myroides marinus]
MELNKNVPTIRFNGFEDEWEEKKLGNIVYRLDNLRKPVKASERISGNIPYYGANGIQDFVDGYTHDGDFVLLAEDGANDLKKYPIQYVKGKIWVNNHAHVIQGIVGEVENLFLKNTLLKTNFEQIIVGGSRSKLNATTMMNIKINSAKTLTEQAQIGNFFKTLDSQINAQEQKHQKLINLKKAMLEKMFPKEGSDLPEIRFKGFTEKWEEKKLGNIVKIFNGYAFQSKNFVLFNSNIIVLTPGNVKVCGGYQAEKGHYYNPNSQYLSKFKFEVNDIFITLTDLTPTGQTLGYPAIIPNDGNIYLHNQRLGKLFDIKTDRLFLYHFLCTNLYHTNVVSTSSGTTVKHSSSEKIQLIKIFVPSLKEQQKIGEYFEKLDNLIQQSQEQIKKYKNIKQALLQKMFV